MIVKGGTYFLDLSSYDLSGQDEVKYDGLYVELQRVWEKAITLKIKVGDDFIILPASILINADGAIVSGSLYDVTNQVLVNVSFAISPTDYVTGYVTAYTPAE